MISPKKSSELLALNFRIALVRIPQQRTWPLRRLGMTARLSLRVVQWVQGRKTWPSNGRSRPKMDRRRFASGVQVQAYRRPVHEPEHRFLRAMKKFKAGQGSGK